jgi:hypothetical protein
MFAVISVIIMLVILLVAGMKAHSKERGAEMIKHIYIFSAVCYVDDDYWRECRTVDVHILRFK